MFYVTDENGNPIPIAGTGANPNLDCLRTELLWTNPKPTVTFEEKKIDVDLSKYDGYRVLFRFHTTDTTTLVQEFVTGTNGVLNALSYNSIFRRNITYSNTSLTFSSMDGYKVSDATRIQNNDYLIPYKIEGVLKTPAMIYTGEELFAGNGISIENGVISADAVLLWENGKPNESFALTTLKNVEDMSKYKYIVVVGKLVTTAVASLTTKIVYTVGSNASLMRIDDSYIGRMFRIESPTSMFIDDGYLNGHMDNTRCIPYRIYGTDIL